MTTPASISRHLTRIHQQLDSRFPRHLERCQDFLRQPSISATGQGIRETADQVAGFISRCGGSVTLCGDTSFPIVHAHVRGASSNTLLVYGMYDVQPADEPTWMSDPFAAAIHDLPGLGPCVVARGAVNSKGALCGVLNVLETLSDVDTIPLNLILAIEGEEEIGSPHFEEFIRTHSDALRADAVVDFDFSQDSRGRAAMHLGLKGIVYLDLICRGGKLGGPADGPVHGSVSAWVSSPAWRLVHALSTLTDRRETITIPGFYENVRGPDRQDMQLLKKLARVFDEKAFLREMKSLCFKYDRHGVALLKKGLYSPIINVNGFHTGYVGPGTKTILPRRAIAKIDVRFGPNMEPDEVVDKLQRHLHTRGFHDIEITVRDRYTWSKTDVSKPAVRHMVNAYRMHGIEPEVWPMATWAAPYFTFSRILGLPVVSGGLGHGGRQHAANEYMTVQGLRDFEKFVATFLYLVARQPARLHDRCHGQPPSGTLAALAEDDDEG
jgi:acetylornithine deacetylase/succinyl-diaminopimelate desuccinylase-like protein